MARATRIFSDLDLNFIANPSTGDISKKFNETAIKQSVKNLILTNFYERLFHPEIGSQVTGLLFEPFSPLLQALLQRAIINTIENYEPRVKLLEVVINLNPDNNSIDVSIYFKIVNTETPLSLNITLKRTR
jgi:phage baseplate assembly protein W